MTGYPASSANSMITLAPIAIFVYSRPAHTKRLIESLSKNKEAQDSDLFIFSDAPRSDAQNKDVLAVRQYIKSIDGFKGVTVIERNSNLGLAASIIDGISQLCRTHGKVIALEDDLLVSAYFLEYMNEALLRYENVSSVMQIAGHMFPVELSIQEDALFLPFTTSWGWATWKRAWQYFDPDMTQYDKLAAEPLERRRFDLDGSYPYFNILKSAKRIEIDTWDIQWYLSVFAQNGLTLFPKNTLVQNIGFDGSGTHSVNQDRDLSTNLADFQVINFPKEAYISEKAYDDVKRFLISRNTLSRKIKNSLYVLKNILNSFKASCLK